MSERLQVQYGTYLIDVEIIRRQRATLEIAVEPDTSVVATAPVDASLDAITAKILKRAAWVRRQQRFFEQYLPGTPERQFVPGETHLYLGRQYRLKVVQHIQATVTLKRGFLVVQSHRPEMPDETRGLIESWYRDKARQKFSERLEVNLLRFPDPEMFRPKGLIIRQLRQRWGSMSPASRLLLNRRLIEAPIDAIDYVITHELCHIEEPNHGPKFYDLLTRILPDWSRRKERLERVMA